MTRKKQMGFGLQAILASLIIAAIFLSGCTSQNPQTQKVYHVGILSGLDAFAGTADVFKEKMTELGYIEGKNIVYDFQKTNADAAGEQRVLEKFVADKVDMIFVFPTEPTVTAKAVTEGTGIPIVFTNAIIEGSNIVESVRQPGGNITGVRFPASETTLKRLEILHELAPQAKRIYVTYDKNYPGISFTIAELNKAAPSMNVTLVEVPVTTLKEIEADFKARSASDDIGIDAVLIMTTLLTAGPDGFEVINKFATEHKLPVAGSTDFNTDMGAVFNYFPGMDDFGKLAAPIADKVLKGTAAGTIPVVSPESNLRLNYKVAQELGLNVSEGLLSRANEIIR